MASLKIRFSVSKEHELNERIQCVWIKGFIQQIVKGVQK
jgi:hypothetical protein